MDARATALLGFAARSQPPRSSTRGEKPMVFNLKTIFSIPVFNAGNLADNISAVRWRVRVMKKAWPFATPSSNLVDPLIIHI